MRILKTIGIAGSAAALLLVAPIAFAESQPTTDGTAPADSVLVQKQERPRIDAMQAKQGKDLRTAQTREGKVRPVMASTTRAELKDRAGMIGLATASTTNFKDGAKAARERMEAVREEAKNRVEAQREKAQQRLSEIKDKAKQEKAQSIAKQFAHINKEWTDHFMNVLDRHDAIMKKIQARADAAAASGKDVSSTTAAIQAARTAIDTARTAVIAQAAKLYELNTSTSTAITVPTTSTTTPNGQAELVQNLRTAFKSMHAALFKDLFALRDGPILAARRAVQAATQSLIRIPGINEGTATTTTATSTATSTNQ